MRLSAVTSLYVQSSTLSGSSMFGVVFRRDQSMATLRMVVARYERKPDLGPRPFSTALRMRANASEARSSGSKRPVMEAAMPRAACQWRFQSTPYAGESPSRARTINSVSDRASSSRVIRVGSLRAVRAFV